MKDLHHPLPAIASDPNSGQVQQASLAACPPEMTAAPIALRSGSQYKAGANLLRFLQLTLSLAPLQIP